MFYAYILTDKKGIVEDWESCKALVNGVSGAKFKKFKTKGWNINEFSNIELGNNYTNNFGELLGCYLALIIANIKGENKIFGDSNLVILKLIEVVAKLRENFNGKIEHISGDINPADLGFHK